MVRVKVVNYYFKSKMDVIDLEVKHITNSLEELIINIKQLDYFKTIINELNRIIIHQALDKLIVVIKSFKFHLDLRSKNYFKHFFYKPMVVI